MTAKEGGIRVVVASCGLGRVQRGNETWALRLAQGLAGRGRRVTLLCGGPLPLAEGRPGLEMVPLPGVSREAWWLRRLKFRERYLLEQKFFFWSMRRWLARHGADVVHLADPQVAWWLREEFRGRAPRVVYKDGLQLGPGWNWRFDHVQVLAPHYLEAGRAAGLGVGGWRVIPHFVDRSLFHPGPAIAANPGIHRRTSPGGGLPGDVPLVLAVGDVAPGSSKRLDWVVGELATLKGQKAPHLVVAGNAEEADADRFRRWAEEKLPGRFHFRPRLDPADMPGLYQRVDLLVHAALREPFGLVLIEAMACGLPVLCHAYPVTQWIVGEGGESLDMEAPGLLAARVGAWIDEPGRRLAMARAAMDRVGREFSEAVRLPDYELWYEAITGGCGEGDR